METTITHQRSRLQSAPSSTSAASGVGPNATISNAVAHHNQGHHHPSLVHSHSLSQSPSPPESVLIPPPSTVLERASSTTSSLANLLDGFTARVSSVSSSFSTVSTPSLTNSLAGISSLGTTANALYSSIGLAFNSLTSPITAAAAASAEAAAVVVAAASAISNHLSSPTSGTPPHNDGLDEDEDCEDDDDDEAQDDDNDNNDRRHVPATTRKKTWPEIKAIVNEIRKQLANLSTLVPTNIQFRTLSDGRLRCYFLSTPPAGWETTLLYADINLNNEDDISSIANEVASHESGSPPSAINTNNIESIIGSPGIIHYPSSLPSSPTGTTATGPSSTTATITTNSTGMNININSGNSFGYHKKRLQWNLVLQQPLSSGAGTGNAGINACSREFQLLQERKRLSTWGITSYELHKLSGKIVFPCLNDLYQCLDTGYNTSPIFPIQLRTNPQWQALDPQICPQNSDLIAYVSGCDIWVTHTLSGHEERLTFSHDGRRPFADDPLSSGVPSYIMQEEFSRYQGYWWQPQSDDGIYRIVYEEVDESDVCLCTFPSSQGLPGEMDEYRFPRTGTANAKSKLKMIQFAVNESLHISDVCIKDLPYSLSVVFPWLEYIVRIGWTPDSNNVWMQGMDRKQQRLDLILIPVDNFCETYSSSASSPSGSGEHSWKSPYSKSMSPLQVIYSQQADTWINVHDLLYFLDFTETSVTFLWASEETGFRHLYLVTSSLSAATINGCKDTPMGTPSNAGLSSSTPMAINMNMYESSRTNSTSSSQSEMHIDCMETGVTLIPRIINKVALTSGEWEVLGRNLWVDKAQQLVYFLGLRDTPLEKHLYVVSLQRPEHIRLLTERNYSYLVEFDESCQLMLQVYCNIQRLPSCKIMRVQQTCQSGGVNGIHLSLVGYLHEGGKPEPQYCPQIYSPQLPSGEIVYAMVFKPHNFQLGVKYPTVLNVYGGPEVQTVNNTFKGKHQLRMHMLAAQGYCVVCIDSRGSRHRGIKFESHIRCRMGQVELNDQVDALRILADQLGYIDMNRVAIHGWSYGGYLSLMGLVQYPHVFKLAIAGAPVTNWEYYDTGYTERYMDLPQNNKHGYTAGSVLNYINSFPEEDNRLLLIHGLIDENVHFFHTSQLITALNKANKPYDLHVFPDERHSLRNLESNKNYETKLLSFLQNL